MIIESYNTNGLKLWKELNPDRCMDSVNSLKTAPKELSSKVSFIDDNFKGRYQMLFWPGYKGHDNFWDINLDFVEGNIGWNRLGTIYPDATLFGNDDKEMINDPIQSTVGNCWVMAAMAAVASKPERIKSLF
tara:strand:- start:189 stop:584 length:396 start_codon:yes stop_codon:yes gene_type:complete